MTKKTKKTNYPYLSIPITLEEVLGNLTNTEASLSPSHLAELSDLPSESFSEFAAAWSKLNAKRRHEVITSLKTIAEENVALNFDVIFKLGLEDSDHSVRLAAISSLWENQQGWLQRKLIAMAQSDPSEEVRAASIQALERFCLKAELNDDQKSKNQLAATLLSILEDPNEPDELRYRSLKASSPMDMVEVRNAIKNAFRSDDRKMQISAVYAMGANCNPSWIPTLVSQLQSNDAELRYEAARACGEIGEEDALSWLIPMIEDEDQDVQLASIQALGKIGGSEAKKALIDLMDSSDDLLRDAAQQSIQELELYNNPFSPGGLNLDEDII